MFKFRPIHFNWVALHPEPIGVIYFIGSTFFGTFPTIFYRYLLRQLYEHGYTIIALPFRFTFRHWSVAISLAKELVQLRLEIATEAQRLGYDYEIYQEKPTLAKPNYFWLAHSRGSKYVALLEILSELEIRDTLDVFGNCVGIEQYRQIKKSLQGVKLEDISLKNQPSLLLAPVITGLESAIPITRLAEILKNIPGFDVQPNVEQTCSLIDRSHLFNLTALIAFAQDCLTSDASLSRDGQLKGTIAWMEKHLSLVRLTKLPKRRHLAPLAIANTDQSLAREVIHSFDILSQQLINVSSATVVAQRQPTAIV